MTAYIFTVVDNLYYPPDQVLHTKENWKMGALFMDSAQPISAVLAGAKEVKKEDAPTSLALGIWRLSCWNRESVFCI